jgi:hypothetical protein
MHSNLRTEHLKKAASGGFASIKPENYFVVNQIIPAIGLK